MSLVFLNDELYLFLTVLVRVVVYVGKFRKE